MIKHIAAERFYNLATVGNMQSRVHGLKVPSSVQASSMTHENGLSSLNVIIYLIVQMLFFFASRALIINLSRWHKRCRKKALVSLVLH